MLSAVRGSRAAPSPSIATLTPSASDRTTSLWSAHARPSASNPGPRLADVAGTLTWTRTRLEPLEEPVRGERDGPGVEDDVVVGEDEHADHDQDQPCRPLDHRDERTVAPEEPQERAEPRGVRGQQADAPSDVVGRRREGEDRAQDRPDARRPANRKRDADRERAEVACRLLPELPLLSAPEDPDSEHADDVQAEDDDEDPADPTDPVAVVEQELARRAERGAERHEDDREPYDEGQRVTQDPPAHRPREVRGEVGDGHARDERQVRRKERQHARRQEREESRAERDGDPEGFAHRDRSSPSISEWDASLSHSRGPSAIAVRWP